MKAWHCLCRNLRIYAMPFNTDYLRHRRRRWGGRKGTGSPGWCNVSKFWAISCILGNFASKFRAISYFLGNIASKFWRFHVVWASFPRKIFRTLDKKTVSRWVNTFFFCFWRSPQCGQKKRLNLSEDLIFFLFWGHLNLDRKTDWFVGELSSHFSGQTLVPLKSFWKCCII